MKISAVLETADLEALTKARLGPEGQPPHIEVSESDLEAIQKMYISGVPDILILDFDLPSVIGLETVRTLRLQREFVNLPILLISRWDVSLDAGASGATDVLTRPFTPEALQEAVKVSASKAKAAPPLPPRPKAPPEPQPQKSDSRKANRKPIETPCVVSTGGRKFKGMLRDISLSGARIQVEAVLPIPGHVSLIAGIQGTVPLKIIEFKAQVVRRTKDGFGLKFREMSVDTRDFVRFYTQH